MTNTTAATVVVITSAVELSSKQLATLKKALESKYGKQLDYQLVVDSSVVGGLKVRVGSTEYNATLQAKFETLRQHLHSHI